MIVCALLSVLAPVADALENGVTDVMLAAIRNFHDDLAYLSSSLSVRKFAMFVFAYAPIIVGALVACLRVRLLPAQPGPESSVCFSFSPKRFYDRYRPRIA